MKTHVPKELSIQPPTEGVTYELGAMYLSNLKEGKPHPDPVEFYLFIDRYGPKNPGHSTHRHFCWTLKASTEEECLDLLREFASRPDVKLVEEESGKVITKDWLEDEQSDHQQADRG